MGEPLEGEKRVRHLDDRFASRHLAAIPSMYYGHRSPTFQRRLRIDVSIEIFALERKEQAAGLRLTRVREYLADNNVARVPDERGAEDFADLSCGGLHVFCMTEAGRKGFGISETGLRIGAHFGDFGGAVTEG